MSTLLNSVESVLDVGLINDYKSKLEDLNLENEILWKQHSIVDLLNEGDKNSSFFHGFVANKRRHNKIGEILDENGDWCTCDHMKPILSGYFTSIFTSLSPHDFQLYNRVSTSMFKDLSISLV